MAVGKKVLKTRAAAPVSLTYLIKLSTIIVVICFVYCCRNSASDTSLPLSLSNLRVSTTLLRMLSKRRVLFPSETLPRSELLVPLVPLLSLSLADSVAREPSC